MQLTDINEIKALLARHGFHFSKALGQNFLCRAWVPEQIAESSGADRGTGVLEIGPGIGSLTAELARGAKRVLCIELDSALEDVLAETLADFDNVEILFADALKVDFKSIIAEHFADCSRVVVCANLPYNITSPILTALIECESFESITVLIQREVAKRICATQKSKDYSAFSVFVQWHMQADILFEVSPDCFIPAPKVHSSVIKLTRRKTPICEVKNERLLMKLVRAAFNQRRKTLANAISNVLPSMDKQEILHAISQLGLAPTVRGEALGIEEFAALSDLLCE